MTDLTPQQEQMLDADLNGARGPEQQQAAEEWCEENGYEVVLEPGEEPQPVLDDEEEFDPPPLESGDPENEEIALEVEAELAEPSVVQGTADSILVENELSRLEEVKGRPLTRAEEDAVINSIPEDGPIPNLTEQWGEKLRTRTHGSREDRRAAMAEAAATRSAEQAEEAPPREQEQPAESKEKPDLWKETPEQRRERMAAAAREAGQEQQEPVGAGLTLGGEDAS